ncbi:hypothetical protein EXN22_11315 [Pseudomonas tructae]|uniref:Uncharacterized protein n=1 Tax=Pseudomonas tructae TaxID=2518644 RepID=A0A411MHC2_9PSED|nr:hypothetical protein [Pseudomonas tructae]QBF26252.1 hypothetical protein EXN22_11315 [Pseudomonas tructae]
MKPLKNRFLAIVMQVELTLNLWVGGGFMIWVLIDRDATRYFEPYAVFAIISLCLFFASAWFVRCPLCNKCMPHLYKPGEGLLMHRVMRVHEVFTHKVIECPECKQLVKLRD